MMRINANRNRRAGERAGRAGGFTLVELLVVISIIALLMAILLPSLNKARETARQIACASATKELMRANLMYADDSDGWFVPTLNNWGMSKSSVRWYRNEKYQNMLSLDTATTGSTGWPDGLLCPSAPDEFLQRGEIRRANSLNGRWYNEDLNNGVWGHSRTGVKFPHEVVEFMDGNHHYQHRRHARAADHWDYSGEVLRRDGGARSVTYRHGEKTTAGFIDGHVEEYSKDEMYPSNRRERRKLWWPYGPDHSPTSVPRN